MHDLHYSVEDHSRDENSDQDVDLNPINTQKIDDFDNEFDRAEHEHYEYVQNTNYMNMFPIIDLPWLLRVTFSGISMQ
jgi:hypothetical protein